MSTLFFLAQAAASEGAKQPGILMQLFPFIIIFALFYLILIRPQQKRQKAHAALVSALQTGDKVITSGGIHGIVSNVKERTVLVKVADNTKIEMDRSAIVSVDRSSESGD